MAESTVVPILEIREEFGTCEICLECYDAEAKSPRILPCFHTFCRDCLNRIWNKSPEGIKCPNCRSLWPVHETIEDTFRQNKTVMNVVEYITLKNKPGEIKCHHCPNNSGATLRCQDCREYMCQLCASYHRKFAVTQRHTLLLISQFMEMPRDEFFQHKDVCKHHDYLTVDLFCKTCSMAVCSSCVLISHRDHHISSLKEVYEAKKQELTAILTDLHTSMDSSKAYKSRLVEQNRTLSVKRDTLLKDIDDSYQKAITQLSNKRKRLRENVISNVSKQQTDREMQHEKVVQGIGDKTQHELYCKQTLSFAGAVDFIEMSEDLVKKTKRISEIPELIDMSIQDIKVDLKTFDNICHILENPSLVYNMSEIKHCIDVSDIKVGEMSTLMTITFLPKENKLEDQSQQIQATIETPVSEKHNVKLNMTTLSLGVRKLVYRPKHTGRHEMFISLHDHQLINDAVIFYSKDGDEDPTRKILFSIDNEPGGYRELSLPTVVLDKHRLNSDECSITEDGYLINQPLRDHPQNHNDPEQDYPEFEDMHPELDYPELDYPELHDLHPERRLTSLYGTTALHTMLDIGCGYWQLDLHCKVLDEAEIGYVAAQAGICFEEQADNESQITSMEDAWCVSLNSCKYHRNQCLKVHSRGVCVYDRPVAGFKANTVVDLKLGLLLDTDRKMLHVVRVDTSVHVYSIPDIDTSHSLMPVFAVYNQEDFDVRLKVISGRDLVLEHDLLRLLSSLIQR